PPPRIRPDATRAPILRGRFVDRGPSRLRIDIGQIAAGQRDEPDLPLWCRCDAIGAPAFRRVPHLHIARLRVEPAVDADLPGEPNPASAVEGRRVEVYGWHPLWRKWPHLDHFRRGVDAHDRVLAAISEPRRAIRSHNDALRCRTLAERDAFD